MSTGCTKYTETRLNVVRLLNGNNEFDKSSDARMNGTQYCTSTGIPDLDDTKVNLVVVAFDRGRRGRISALTSRGRLGERARVGREGEC